MSIDINLRLYQNKTLLFSIPVHEKQDIIHNQIENILHFNPGSKIILHLNQSYTDFIPENCVYQNVYFHQTKITYTHGKDLFAFHIANFLYCIQQNVIFDFFVLSASNEMFFKKGSIQYIEEYKNGLQMVDFDSENQWHNFHKDIERLPDIISLLDKLKLPCFCGGQAEGQFYEKKIFQRIVDIYLETTQNYEKTFSFEAEEIIPQSIFKSFQIELYGRPLTLQNYSNAIDFNVNFIKSLYNGCIIKDKTIKKSLTSPHVNCHSHNEMFSLKRIDRTFNECRNLLTNKGFILNKNDYFENIPDYSNNSSISISKDNILFQKLTVGKKEFQWFGFQIPEGVFQLRFQCKANQYINPFMNVGVKLHFPNALLYTQFWKYVSVNIFKEVVLNIHSYQSQNLLFIFDELYNSLQFEIQNLQITKNISYLHKKNIIIILYQKDKSDKYIEQLYNLHEILIRPFQKIYNVYIHLFLFNEMRESHIQTIINPDQIHYYKKLKYSTIFETIKTFIKTHSIPIEFYLIQNFQYIYSDIKFIVNKINFLSYQVEDNKLQINKDIILIPHQYFTLFLGNQNLLKIMRRKKIQFHLLLNNFYYKNSTVYKINNISTLMKNGFLFTLTYIPHVPYKNKFCFFQKINKFHFNFYKKPTYQYQDFIWFGSEIKFSTQDKKQITVIIQFEIKCNLLIQKQSNIGFKTHEPLQFYNNWMDKCELNQFTKIHFKVNIERTNQLMIFNFDNYFQEIDCDIKNFTMITDYNL